MKYKFATKERKRASITINTVVRSGPALCAESSSRCNSGLHPFSTTNETTMKLESYTYEDDIRGRDYVANVSFAIEPGARATHDGPGYGPEVKVSRVELIECIVWNPGRRKNGVVLQDRDENYAGFKINTEAWLRGEIEVQLQSELDSGHDIGGSLPPDPAYQRMAARNPVDASGRDWT